MGDYELDTSVSEARKLIAGDLVGLRLDPAVYQIQEQRALGTVTFSVLQHGIEIGRFEIKPGIGDRFAKPAISAIYTARKRGTIDATEGLIFQPDDEERDQVFEQIRRQVYRTLDTFLGTYLKALRAAFENRHSMQNEAIRSEERPKTVIIQPRRAGPKPGPDENQKAMVRRYHEALQRGERQNAFCVREGIASSTLRRWERAMEESGEL